MGDNHSTPLTHLNPQGKIEYVVNGKVRYTSQQVPAYALHPKVIA